MTRLFHYRVYFQTATGTYVSLIAENVANAIQRAKRTLRTIYLHAKRTPTQVVKVERKYPVPGAGYSAFCLIKKFKRCGRTGLHDH